MTDAELDELERKLRRFITSKMCPQAADAIAALRAERDHLQGALSVFGDELAEVIIERDRLRAVVAAADAMRDAPNFAGSIQRDIREYDAARAALDAKPCSAI